MQAISAAARAGLVLSFLVSSCGIVAAASPVASVVRVSTKANGGQVFAESQSPKISPDGKQVVFSSLASNLVAGDTNGRSDIFLKTLSNNAIKLISTSSAGVKGNNSSYGPVFSPDGKKVAFYSFARNFDGGKNPLFIEDVYVKDLVSGKLTLVSKSKSGVPGNDDSIYPVFTPDGKSILFQSKASNLVPNDTNGVSDIFIKSLTTGSISRLSTTLADGQLNGPSFQVRMAPSGVRFMYSSQASNLFNGDTSGTDIFLYDGPSDNLYLVSSNSAGQQANSDCNLPEFSPDSNWVVFESNSTNLVSTPTGGMHQIFLKSLTTGKVTLISASKTGAAGNANSDHARFSPDGKSVIFESVSSNLVAGDSNQKTDIFIKTISTGAITRVSVAASGLQSNDHSSNPMFGPNAKMIAYASKATKLVSGDSNSVQDVFVAKLK
ncbi:TolB family protein [Oryzibacter oryziterrae]|uniref:TolB family protein n=1 Tax=Oryzibacter oryziterrae TaxID=2766474 RepID=UPI001F16E652|nr:hypothetical protein [Oryzibacter oryziterrae]